MSHCLQSENYAQLDNALYSNVFLESIVSTTFLWALEFTPKLIIPAWHVSFKLMSENIPYFVLFTPSLRLSCLLHMIFTADRGNYFQTFCKNLNLLLGVSLLQNLTLSRQLKMAFWKSKMLIGNFSLEFSNKIFRKVFENLFSQEYGLNSIWNPKSKAHISWSPNTVSNAQDSQRKPFATLF